MAAERGFRRSGKKVKYYVLSDIHGFYAHFVQSLETAGYFSDTGEKKLVILGDLFDRGKDAVRLQEYISELIDTDSVILIRGNHEDLFCNMVTEDGGLPYSHHISNGTYDTGIQLTGYQPERTKVDCAVFAEKARQTEYYTKIIPAMRDYFETEHYIFVHGWIPCVRESYDRYSSYIGSWRMASKTDWARARWYNGIDAGQAVTEAGKTIICGHWHCSYGHNRYEHRGSQFDGDAVFTPYYAPGMIAIDACTTVSGMVNCIVVED